MISFIKEYIEKLDKIKVNDFLLNNNISLKAEELDYLYNILQKNWYDFIYENPEPILRSIKENINDKDYHSLYLLYKHYLNKYKNYL